MKKISMLAKGMAVAGLGLVCAEAYSCGIVTGEYTHSSVVSRSVDGCALAIVDGTMECLNMGGSVSAVGACTSTLLEVDPYVVTSYKVPVTCCVPLTPKN